ncbi:P-loop containing nucleoside triphosphate hydrolase protein [Mycena rebaudengoi]|nr:P-loop containing nucleoside triphosphate hydrolase protein [Mycena rebaudengoi]
MAENDLTPVQSWPPPRIHDRDMSTPRRVLRTPLATINHRSPLNGSPSQSGNQQAKKQHRNGYVQAPRTPSYSPFSLNNPGTPRQKAFAISNPDRLESIDALDPEQWNDIALKARAIPTEAQLRSFPDYNLESSADETRRCCGNIQHWAGISLAVTPFTSLGLDGEISNDCDGISSIFIYSEKNTQKDFERVATGEMLVVYVCPEMLESPSFARLVHSTSWQGRLSALYIDEAHLIHQTISWRPPYGRIYLLRNIIGHDIPLICLSATCPKLYRDSLVSYAGLSPNHTLLNLGNYRPELSTIILPMKHEISSFQDITFILPLGCREKDVIPSLVYCDDLELLTNMFWWAFQRAASMQIPTHVVDIIHSGLSARHQELCLQDFRSGKTKILLGSSKISAGMNFPGVRRVLQYKCRDLTVADFDQRRGRGARRKGETAVGMIFVEPSMMPGGGLSIDAPGDQDPGMVELCHSAECVEAIIQRRLENPQYSHNPACDSCNRCDSSLQPARDYQWITVNPAPATSAPSGVRATDAERESLYLQLISWRLEHWRSDWRTQWPSYGPKSLISDSDLEDLAKHVGKISAVNDMLPYTHIIHWEELSVPLFAAIQAICLRLNLVAPIVAEAPQSAAPVGEEPPRKRRRVTATKPEVLQSGEMIIEF